MSWNRQRICLLPPLKGAIPIWYEWYCIQKHQFRAMTIKKWSPGGMMNKAEAGYFQNSETVYVILKVDGQY